MPLVQVDLVKEDNGTTVLERDMARMGRAKHASWLIKRIKSLTESDVDTDFNGWPTLQDEEGQWGSLEIDVYVVMCQLLKPPIYKLRLGAPILMKVAGVGTRATILKRLEELEKDSDGNDEG